MRAEGGAAALSIDPFFSLNFRCMCCVNHGMTDIEQWAETEFGTTDLGDKRRTDRLIRLAAEVARHPAGTVTRACASSASREGAFRWLENWAVRPEPVTRAVEDAALKRCRGQRRVYVPVDATSLTVTDRARSKGFGGVGAWSDGSRGVHVMSAFAVNEDGCPLGICGQRMWVRENRSQASGKGRSGDLQQRETRFWLDLLENTHAGFAKTSPGCTPWYQLDRGADCWPVFELAQRLELLLTVRAAHDRRLDGRAQSLWSAVEYAAVRAHLEVKVPARPGRRKRQRRAGRRIHWRTPPQPARIARIAIRAATVPLMLTTATGKRFVVHVNAVLAREKGRHDEKIEWLLLTTHPIRTRADVVAVVRGYTLRWRIEDLHRTWKSGLCRVEDSQLRSRDAFFKWATLLGTVASRAMRITHRARNEPDVPATEELTRIEIEALIALRQPKQTRLTHVPTLAQAVRWLADLGGYTGPWNGPPGPTVVGRGLQDVLAAARAFESRDRMR
jgi:hypothetical protein